jgi:hypothetical protein
MQYLACKKHAIIRCEKNIRGRNLNGLRSAAYWSVLSKFSHLLCIK